MSKNGFKTFILLAGLTALLLFIGQAMGGRSGLYLAFFMALLMNFIGYWFSDKIALKMSGAQEVTVDQAPDLHRTVERLSAQAGLPKPRVYIMPQDTPNAFATGRNPEHAAVAVTEGILRLLKPEELDGVLAHELAHIKNRDILISSVAAVMAGAISHLAYMAQWGAMFGMGRSDDEEGGGAGNMIAVILMAIIGPMAAMLIQMAISRSREFSADATGAKIIHAGRPLANALLKLESYNKQLPMQVNPATAQMYIVNPLSARGLTRLFSTHPPIQERVDRLMALKVQDLM
ncbi:MAG: Heat shock protein [Deltaproteobacteria bacterium]|jgi:heat shock protein HtpX|nr:Heat shock protein [Deltaproteobacteria bacterium]MBP1716736.1 Heat shock protein [Deltaproteobacteria bacterium]